jgi:hypothetical protein
MDDRYRMQPCYRTIRICHSMWQHRRCSAATRARTAYGLEQLGLLRHCDLRERGEGQRVCLGGHIEASGWQCLWPSISRSINRMLMRMATSRMAV